ncbi:MAG TPA: tetratricopeptide repeat protein, partial [Myxococcota bacterium]|nr:tetratricopeptide repeat protein [Myxococcota bacterium]
AAIAAGYLRQGMLDDARALAIAITAPAGDPNPHQEALDTAREVSEVAQLLSEEADRERYVDLARAEDDEDFARAVQMYADGDEHQALGYLEQRPSLVRRNASYLMFYGYLLYRAEQFDSARKMLQRARRMPDSDPLKPAIAYYLGREAYSEGDYKRAVQEMLLYRQIAKQPLSALKAED